MTKPYELDDVPHRRPPPEGSGVCATVGFGWEEIIQGLSNEIGKAAPEVRQRTTMWIVRARPNGVQIDFYDDEDVFYRRLQQDSLTDGPQIHAGRLHWM